MDTFRDVAYPGCESREFEAQSQLLRSYVDLEQSNVLHKTQLALVL